MRVSIFANCSGELRTGTRALPAALATAMVLALSACATPFGFVFAEVQADSALLEQAVPVSSFGYDPVDSTSFLQAAFDSEYSVIRIDRQAGAWVSETLILPSNKTIIFDRGVVLQARPGAFRDKGAMLLRGDDIQNLEIIGYGAEIRMRRQDYVSDDYLPSEFRHAISLWDARNVSISGLKISDSGGDGVYIGANTTATGRYSANIVLRDLWIRGNHRQGISVISVEGLLIDHCLIEDTAGTAPSAGIDFEPNRAMERLTNIVVRDSWIRRNQGPGILVQLQQFDKSSRPVDIRIISTIVEGNLLDLSVLGTGPVQGGTIDIVDSRFAGPRFILQGGLKVRERSWADEAAGANDAVDAGVGPAGSRAR